MTPRTDGRRDAPALRSRAFIKVQDGCDHRCTYCIGVAGAWRVDERSRSSPRRSRAAGALPCWSAAASRSRQPHTSPTPARTGPGSGGRPSWSPHGRPPPDLGDRSHMSHLQFGSHRHYAALKKRLRTGEARPDAVLLGDMNLWGPPVRVFRPSGTEPSRDRPGRPGIRTARSTTFWSGAPSRSSGARWAQRRLRPPAGAGRAGPAIITECPHRPAPVRPGRHRMGWLSSSGSSASCEVSGRGPHLVLIGGAATAVTAVAGLRSPKQWPGSSPASASWGRAGLHRREQGTRADLGRHRLRRGRHRHRHRLQPCLSRSLPGGHVAVRPRDRAHSRRPFRCPPTTTASPTTATRYSPPGPRAMTDPRRPWRVTSERLNQRTPEPTNA